MVTTTISVTKKTYRAMLTTHLLPAIEQRWSEARCVVQQDITPSHIAPDDAQFRGAVRGSTKDVQLVFQPANSPDMNALDLGLFSAIQSRQRQQQTRTIEQLIDAVTAAYWNMPPTTINNAFLSLHSTMDQCIVHKGDNDFRISHLSKAK